MLVATTIENVKDVLKKWIDEADHETIERVYNENFDGLINFNPETELFEMDEDEAIRTGIDLE